MQTYIFTPKVDQMLDDPKESLLVELSQVSAPWGGGGVTTFNL